MSDIFAEVDEDLRADRAQKMLKKYGGLLAGAAVVAVAAHTMDGTARPMIAAIAACACAAFVLAWLALGARGQAKATR